MRDLDNQWLWQSLENILILFMEKGCTSDVHVLSRERYSRLISLFTGGWGGWDRGNGVVLLLKERLTTPSRDRFCKN